jgi:hypothetical protein
MAPLLVFTLNMFVSYAFWPLMAFARTRAWCPQCELQPVGQLNFKQAIDLTVDI